MSEIAIRGLSKRYGTTRVVEGHGLTVGEGEFVSLLGPSGCGKTTTLRCIAGLEQPDEGTISIGTDAVTDGARGFSVPPDKRHLGMVFQSYALWPHMTVFGNVAYPLKVQRQPSAQIDARVREVLELVGLAQLAHRAVSELSGGQQQRIAVARALAGRPRVLLLDEPLSNLDASLRAHMRRELRRIHQEVRTTSVYVTHDQLEAVTLSDRVVVMNGGKIQQSGSPRAVFSAPANRWVAEFVGFDNFIQARVVEVRGDVLITRADDWDGTLACPLAAGQVAPRPGAAVTLAARSSGFVPGDAQPGNRIAARVVEAMFVGDTTEYVLEAGNTRLSVKLHEAAGVPLAAGAMADIAVPPGQLVALVPTA
jgi:iron(III) transport system ATP-binding protein